MEKELTVLDSLKIYQPKNGYRFSFEPFVLTSGLDIKDSDKVLDYGSGCGIIPVLLSKINTKCSIYALENNPDMVEILKLNIDMNPTNNISAVTDIKTISTNSMDIVVSNPPYFIEGFYRKSQNFHREKFESKSLDEFLKDIRRIIKNKGLLRISYHPTRTIEMIYKLNEYGFGIKFITPVYGNKNKDASFVIIESKSSTKNHLVLKKPIYLEDFRYY